MRLAKALIRLRVCADWSEPLLVAHTTLLEISCHGSYAFVVRYKIPIAQLVASLIAGIGNMGLIPVRPHTFIEIKHEIFYTVILILLPLIQVANDVCIEYIWESPAQFENQIKPLVYIRQITHSTMYKKAPIC